MAKPLFDSTPRTSQLVNRQAELQTIEKAIYQAPPGSCQIVLLKAPGGLGKSRLAEEILWRGGNAQLRDLLGENMPASSDRDWSTRTPRAVFGNLIDMAEAGYHARLNFIQAVRNALVWVGSPVTFPGFDAIYQKLQSQRHLMGDAQRIEQLSQEAEARFLEELRHNAKKQRLVLVLDTVERLAPIGGTQWLREKDLLSEADLHIQTYYWLLDGIRTHAFANITLILAGRDTEPQGQQFFEDVTAAASQNSECEVFRLPLRPFTLEETHEYLDALAACWEEAGNQGLANDLRTIAAQNQLTETLHAYTGGASRPPGAVHRPAAASRPHPGATAGSRPG